MPPTTSIKKFKQMLNQKKSDLTLALDHLFEAPEVFQQTHWPATAAELQTPDYFKNPLDVTKEVWKRIEQALTATAGQVPVHPADPDKVREHIDNWPNGVADGDGKEELRLMLLRVLDDSLNPPNPHGKKKGVKFHWTMEEGNAPDRIEIEEHYNHHGLLKSTVNVTFVNYWEHVQGDIDITL